MGMLRDGDVAGFRGYLFTMLKCNLRAAQKGNYRIQGLEFWGLEFVVLLRV